MANQDHIYIEIGRLIKKARQKKRLTQERLAGLVSLTRTSITNIEKGRQKLPIHALYNFASSLDVNIKELIPEDIKQPSKSLEQKLPKDLSKKEITWVKSVMERGVKKRGHSKKND